MSSFFPFLAILSGRSQFEPYSFFLPAVADRHRSERSFRRFLASEFGDYGKSEIARNEFQQKGTCRKATVEQALGGKGANRLHSLSQGTIHEGCIDHRTNLGGEKSFTQGAGLRHAHAHLFHESGR